MRLPQTYSIYQHEKAKENLRNINKVKHFVQKIQRQVIKNHILLVFKTYGIMKIVKAQQPRLLNFYWSELDFLVLVDVHIKLLKTWVEMYKISLTYHSENQNKVLKELK